MNFKGINYDVGTKTIAGRLTREIFDPNIVAREIEIIKSELHCNAIRISGLDIERLVRASEIALQLGLTVWFSPALRYDNQENIRRYIIESAMAAEKLRSVYPNLIFVVGCELSLFTSGFIKGERWETRLKNLFFPLSLVKNIIGIKRKYNVRLNAFLFRIVNEIKKTFQGRITYASGTWEKIDWNIFDLQGIDHYRSSFNKMNYQSELKNFKKTGKPLCIMEFGCCAYRGADDKGAMGWAIVDWKKERPEMKADFIRDESVQAKYILDLLNIFEAEELYASFVFTFISYNYLYDENPRYDLDMASYGIVKSLPEGRPGYKGLPWLPKQAFYELARYCETH